MLRKLDYEKKQPIIELFNSIQGESVEAGTPTIFVRMSGCNLRCCFDNSICDTAYSSFSPEKNKFTYKDVEDIIEKYPLTTTLCISGGEPCLNQEVLFDLIQIGEDYNMDISIETNGSIVVDEKLLKRIDLANISPKLSSSEPTNEKLKKFGLSWTPSLKKHASSRYNKEALWNLIEYTKDYRLKYVVGCREDFKEIESQIKDLIDFDIERKCRKRYPTDFDGQELWYDNKFINPRNIILMPAGSSNDELDQNRKMVAEYCAEHGYHYSDRLQIVIWEKERNK